MITTLQPIRRYATLDQARAWFIPPSTGALVIIDADRSTYRLFPDGRAELVCEA